MKRPRKWGPGEPFYTLTDFIRFVRDRIMDADAIVWVGRPEHVAYTANRSFLSVVRTINCGGIAKAEITDAYREWVKQELEQ